MDTTTVCGLQIFTRGNAVVLAAGTGYQQAWYSQADPREGL